MMFNAASAAYRMSPGFRGRSVIVVILAVICIIALLVGVGIYALEETVISLEGDKKVNVQLMLSGDDVVVSIYPGHDASFLTSITLHIDGVVIPAGQETRRVSVRNMLTYITYSDLAKGVTGQHFIMITGSFQDGSGALIYTNKISFT
jgi:cytochrome b